MSSDAAITDDALEEEEGDFGDWVEDEGEISEQRKTKCLFSKRVYANAHEALTRAATDFGFDLRRVVLNTNNNAENETTSNSITKDGNEDDENELEFYDVIKVINFVRKMVLEETENKEEQDEKELAKRVIERVNDRAWKDDVYLMPVDASGSDPLTYEWESYVYGVGDDDDDDDEEAPVTTTMNDTKADQQRGTSQNEQSASALMISSLRSENETLKLKVFEMMQKLGMISEEGVGAVVYLPQEGRGIGLVQKIRAYALQDTGLDTVEANLALGFPADSRDYGIGIQLLKDIGLSKVRLLTNNPKKTDAFIYGGFDLEVVDQVPIQPPPNQYNERYLATKREKMGHNLPER